MKTVREIFRMCVDGAGFKHIAAALNERGVPSARGRTWASSAVRSMLVNPVYRGDLVWNRRSGGKFFGVRKERTVKRADGKASRLEELDESQWVRIEGAVPALVSSEIWDRAQEAVKERSLKVGSKGHRGSAKKRRFLLSGLLKCGDCGFNWWGEPRRRRSVSFDQYSCGGRRTRGRSVCASPSSIRAEEIEGWVLGKLRQEVMGDSLGVDGAVERFVRYATKDEGPDKGKELRRQIKEVESVLRAILANISPANLEMLDDKLTELRLRKAGLERQLEAAKGKRKRGGAARLRSWAKEQFSRLAEALQGRCDEVSRRVLGAYIDSLTLTPSMKRACLVLSSAACGVASGPPGVWDKLVAPTGFEPVSRG